MIYYYDGPLLYQIEQDGLQYLVSWMNENKWGVFEVSQTHIDQLLGNTKTLYSIMQHANQIYEILGEDLRQPSSLKLISFLDIPSGEQPEINTFLKF